MASSREPRTYTAQAVILWPLFRPSSLLAGLAFLVIIFWMKRRGMPAWFMAVPAVFMLVFPGWAMAHQIFVQGVGMDASWIEKERWLLVGMGIVTLMLEIWMLVEAWLCWKRSRVLNHTDFAKPEPVASGD